MDEDREEGTPESSLSNGFDLSISPQSRKRASASTDDDPTLFAPPSRRYPNEIYRETCQGLPKNWIREVTVRKNGLMMNMHDVRYISPTSEVFERKSQLLKYFGKSWDLDGFDYKTGTTNQQLKKWIKLKPQFYPDLPPLESNCDPELDAPIRQTASIFKQPVSLVKPTTSPVRSESTEGSRDKPKQIFWHKRLEGIRSDNPNMELPSKIHLLNPPLVGMKSEAIPSALRSLANSLHMNSFPITGQSLTGDETENLDPTIFINPDQPLIQSVAVFEEDVQSQEDKLQEARSRLADALGSNFDQ